MTPVLSVLGVGQSFVKLRISWPVGLRTKWVLTRTDPGNIVTVLGRFGRWTTAYQDKRLLPSTTYKYQMSYSNSAYSNLAIATTTAAPVVPLFAPSNLAAVAVVPAPVDVTAKIALTWTSNSAGNESGFAVERAPVTGLVTGAYTQIATTAKSVTTYTDAGLPFSTTFSYRVRALA